MKKLAGWFVAFPLGLALVVFLVANRQPVAISFDPISTESPAIATPPLPLWLWLTASLLVGFLLGAVGMWVSGAPARTKARAARAELKALQKDLAARPAAPPESIPTIEAR